MNTPMMMRRAATGSLILVVLAVLTRCGSGRSDGSSGAPPAAHPHLRRNRTENGGIGRRGRRGDGRARLHLGRRARQPGRDGPVRSGLVTDGPTEDRSREQPAGQLQLRLTDAESTVTLTDGREVPVPGRVIVGDPGSPGGSWRPTASSAGASTGKGAWQALGDTGAGSRPADLQPQGLATARIAGSGSRDPDSITSEVRRRVTKKVRLGFTK